jgi:hypothetical protein
MLPPVDAEKHGETASASTSQAPTNPKAEDVKMEPEEEPLPEDILNASVDEINTRTRLVNNDITVGDPFSALSLLVLASSTTRHCAMCSATRSQCILTHRYR